MGGKGGGGGSGDSAEARELTALQAQIARQLFEQTGGLRDIFFGAGGQPGILEDFATTGAAPTALVGALTPLRENTEDAFQSARENIIGRTGARGGQLSQSLIDLETDRARTVAGLEAPLRGELFNLAASTGLGAPGQAVAGLGGSASQFMQLASMEQQRRAQGAQGAGALAGLGLGAAHLAAAGPAGLAIGGGGGLLLGSLGKK